jgi:hypothetical protein
VQQGLWVFRAVIGLLWVLVLVSFPVFRCFVFELWLVTYVYFLVYLEAFCAFFNIYNINYQKTKK